MKIIYSLVIICLLLTGCFSSNHPSNNEIASRNSDMTDDSKQQELNNDISKNEPIYIDNKHININDDTNNVEPIYIDETKFEGNEAVLINMVNSSFRAIHTKL